MSGNKWVEIDATFKVETDAAIMVEEGEQWIPKSLIRDWDDFMAEEGDPIEIEVKQWFAEKEGMV